MTLVVVLPTYNEKENIEHHLRRVLERPAHPDVIVVDDSSPDGTADIVRRMETEFPGRVRLLSRPVKQGLAHAYAAGFALALTGDPRPDVVIQMDVDGSHDPADIDRLVAAVDGGADLAVGSRYVPGGDVTGWSRGREWLSRGGNTYARLLLHSPVHDLTGGFKAWRSGLLSRMNPERTRDDGYGFQIEMTTRAIDAGARVVEVPIVFRDRALGQSKMSGRIAFEALLSVPTLRRKR